MTFYILFSAELLLHLCCITQGSFRLEQLSAFILTGAWWWFCHAAQ